MDADDATAMRAAGRDPDQFSVIFDRHHRAIWQYVARLAGKDVADEIVGDVFVTAFVRRSTFDARCGEVRAWLYGIATNRLRTHLRGEARARRAFARVGGQRPDVVDRIELIDDAAGLRARTSSVLEAMSYLQRSDRELLVLYAWQRLTYDDIAKALDIPIGTVRSRLWRARQRLRELLADGGGEVLSDVTNKEML